MIKTAENRQKPENDGRREGPASYRSSLARAGGARRDLDDIRRDAWLEHGALTVSVLDQRLTDDERAVMAAAGERIYGARPGARSADPKRFDVV